MPGQFELKVKSANRWSFHSYKNSENEAVQEARALLKQKIADQVQVIQTAKNGEKKTVFDEDLTSIKKKAGLGHISTCAVWKTSNDLFTSDNRQTLAYLLRDYFDQQALTPTEVLHAPRDLAKLMEDPLFFTALDRLASLQAVRGRMGEKDQRTAVQSFFEEVLSKAQGAGFDEIEKGGLDRYLAESGSYEDPATRYRILSSVCRITAPATSWEAKLTLLFDLLGDQELTSLHDNTKKLLDEMLAEMFIMPAVIQEMLGKQPDRYNAIKVLTEMCIAKYEPLKWDTLGLKRISALMRTHPMPHSRRTLADRVEQMLRNRTALTKGEIYEEKHAFKELLPLYIAKNGTLLGGEGMAEALTMCGTRSFNRDRTLDQPQEAINYIVDTLQAPVLQLRYLLTLSKSQFGQDCDEIVCEFIPKFMDGPEHVHDIVHYKLPVKRKLKVLSTLQRMALEISLPQKANLKLVQWLDDLLYTFLDEERVIDRMDSPEDPLFIRATNLLQFCASSLLIEGRTLNWVRERVQEHLRQPNFVEKFTEAANTQTKKDKMITQLDIMLKKAGLKK